MSKQPISADNSQNSPSAYPEGNSNQYGGKLVRGKVVFVGASGVGKTSLVFSYLNEDINHPPTVGASSITCNVKLGNETITLNVWDTAGQDEFKFLMPVYARGAEVAVVVYDTSNGETFEVIDEWVNYFLETVPPGNIILVGNKIDLPLDIDEKIVFEYKHSKNIPYIRTSALTKEGINELFLQIAECVQKNKIVEASEVHQQIVLPDRQSLTPPPKQQNDCC